MGSVVAVAPWGSLSAMGQRRAEVGAEKSCSILASSLQQPRDVGSGVGSLGTAGERSLKENILAVWRGSHLKPSCLRHRTRALARPRFLVVGASCALRSLAICRHSVAFVAGLVWPRGATEIGGKLGGSD